MPALPFKKSLPVLLLGTLIWLTGCERGLPDAAVWGTAKNQDRIQRKLCVVTDAMTVETRANSFFWTVKDIKRPCYVAKSVTFENGILIQEQDNYESDRIFPVGDPDRADRGDTRHETLSVMYDYRLEKLGKVPWFCWWTGDKFDGFEQLSLSDAEKLLAKWGIKRLNY